MPAQATQIGNYYACPHRTLASAPKASKSTSLGEKERK